MQHRTLLLLTLIGTMVFAVGCRHKQRSCEEKTLQDVERRALDRTGWWLDDIDATNAQRDRINAIVKRTVPVAYELRDLKKPTKEMFHQELLMSSKPNDKRLHRQLDVVSTDLTEFAHFATDKAVEVHAILTAKQRADIADEWEDREQRPWGESSWMVDAGLNHALDEIDATDKQYELVLDKKDLLLTKAGSLEPERKAARGAMIEELRSNKANADRIHKVVDSMSRSLTGFAHFATDHVSQVSAALTVEQKMMIDAYIQQNKRCD